MGTYDMELSLEKNYLAQTTAFIESELQQQEDHLSKRKKNLLEARREMYENTVHYSNDFARMTEINQHLSELNSQTNTYGHTEKQVERLHRMKDNPYFARFDFSEESTRETEKIYLGISTLMDSEDYTIHVYDWRSPIGGIFYRCEPGPASYEAPQGTVNGHLSLKRQFRIRKAELIYFFDSSVQIRDEMLQEALGRNASPKMRTIVETIQKEQDRIIRDIESDALIVQGAAGSGKTSIALHRIAFLMYEGLSAKLESNNILILSPNTVFERYIAKVLPDLGEEATAQVTLEELLGLCLNHSGLQGAKSRQIEAMLSGFEKRLTHWVAYKGSEAFIQLLNRLLLHAERKLIRFEDIQYAGVTLFTASALKNEFLNNKTNAPMAKRLKRIESRVLERMKPLHRKRVKLLEELVEQKGGHEFEIRSYARLLAMKESKAFVARLKEITEINCRNLYIRLFKDGNLFRKLAEGLPLPEDPQDFCRYTLEALEAGHLPCEDAAAVAYLTLKSQGHEHYPDIRQVVIDEAQDYLPLHYAIFKELFTSARFTIIGDPRQTIGTTVNSQYSTQISQVLNMPRTACLSLERSYRSTLEITEFSQKILGNLQPDKVFERHGPSPTRRHFPSLDEMSHAICEHSRGHLASGYESVAILCKTKAQAQQLHRAMGHPEDVSAITGDDQEVLPGIVILPIYLAKGLEFDVVLLAGADCSYSEAYDRHLLYIACTRALHQLHLYAHNPWSPLLPDSHLPLEQDGIPGSSI